MGSPRRRNSSAWPASWGRRRCSSATRDGANTLRQISEQGRWPRHAWLYLLGHLAAIAGFTLLTAPVLEGEFRSHALASLWILAWGLMGLLAVALWGAAARPAGLQTLMTKRWAGASLAGLVVGAAAWGAGRLTDTLWRPLGRSTFWAVRGLLGLISEVDCQPDDWVLGTPTFAVQIAPECSGYEGIGLIWVFLVAYLWLFRQRLRFPGSLLLLPIGTAVMWAANVVRIATLVAVGTWGSRDVALGGFHSQAGWLAFNAVALGLVAVAHHTPWFTRQVALPETAAGLPPTAAYLAPLLAIVATTMITAAFSSGFDRFYPLRVLAVAAALGVSWRAYTELQWNWSWNAVALGIAVFALWMALEPWHAGRTDGSVLKAGLTSLTPGGAGAWLAFRVFGSVVTVPLAEELAFRGYLTRRLIAPDFTRVPPGQFTWTSFLGSSLLFGAMHGRWVAGTAAGMLYALAFYRRGKLADAVVAHAVTNALIAASVLSQGAWGLWE